MHLYSKKVPAKDAAQQFVQRVRRAVPEAERVQYMRSHYILIKHGYSQAVWRPCLDIHTKGIDIVVDAKLADEVPIFVQLHIVELTFSYLQR
eukprot:6193808-Ditylum_brightwellii.AAC.1